jgi:predicted restriction endonuclease
VATHQIEYADLIDVKSDLPQKVLTEIYRILRDTALARKIKERHSYVCQVCGLEPIQLPNGNFYAEAHHLKPLGKHGGLDIEGNIICVCPNCHAKLDYGVIKLEIEKLQTHKFHKVEKSFVKYHNKEIYNKTSYK